MAETVESAVARRHGPGHHKRIRRRRRHTDCAVEDRSANWLGRHKPATCLLPHAATGHGLPPGFPESHTVRGDLAAGATYDLFLLVGAVLGLLLIDRIS
ncbi:hypothetical protein GCM10010390_86530 [Streptomyces mordarskii]|uniref:Uncharacterized protein n=1 Tax=Streptomyces mordarskii TaxID=1226758 RepID=A0ABP3PQU3_9ACTN